MRSYYESTDYWVNYYTYIPKKFCIRCGIKNPNYEETKK